MAFKRNNNVIDSPGNSFATLNPLVGKTSHANYVYGNLSLEHVSNGECFALSSIKIPKTGKWYVELQMPSNGIFGVTKEYITSSGDTSKIFLGINEDGIKYQNGGNTQLGSEKGMGGGSEVAGLLIDPEAETGNLKWFYSNVEVHSEDYDLKSDDFFVLIGKYSGGSNIINFGHDHTFDNRKTDSAGHAPTDGSPGQFYYPPPEGAKALCSANLSTTVENPQEHFKAVTWTGTDDTSNSITTVGFQPDLVWAKSRSHGYSNLLYDSVRGAGANKELTSDSTVTEGAGNPDTHGHLSAFTSNGFSSTTGNTGNYYFNGPSTTYVAWCWKAGGGGGKYNIDGVPYLDFANTGLTAGDIEPIGMSVNTKAGFSIIKYTGTGSAASVPHGLSVTPEFVVVKNLKDSTNWLVYHKSLSSDTHYLHLEKTDKEETNSAFFSAFSPNTFTLGSANHVNGSNDDIIAYCWHSVPGYSAFGSYTSLSKPFIYTGFKPAFVMAKRIDTSTSNTSWTIFDNVRDPHNTMTKTLYANRSAGEGYRGDGSTSNPDIAIDFLSNGIKIQTDRDELAGNIVYMAFAEHSM